MSNSFNVEKIIMRDWYTINFCALASLLDKGALSSTSLKDFGFLCKFCLSLYNEVTYILAMDSFLYDVQKDLRMDWLWLK